MSITSLNNSEIFKTIADNNAKKFIDIPDAIQGSSALADSKKAEIKKAAEGFEAIFINMMLKEMKVSLFGDKDNLSDGENSNNLGADTLQSYNVMLLSEQLSKSGNGIGIANLIYKQLTGEDLKTNSEQIISQTVIPQRNIDTEQIKSKEKSVSLNLNTPPKIEKQSPNQSAINGNFLNRVQNRLYNYKDIISNASDTHKIPEELIQAVITAESAARPDAVSKAGAKGLMQLMDGTASRLNVNNSFDPKQNIQGGTKYLRQMLDRFGNNLQMALAAYNAGPGNVEKYNGIPPFEETQNYVKRVMRYYEYYSNNKETENI